MAAKFPLDENLSFDLISLIEKRGYRVYHIKKLGKTGIRNGEVYKLAEQMGCWILTRDTDFQILEKFLRSRVKGIIVYKKSDTRIPAVLKSVRQLFVTSSKDFFFESKLILMEDDGTRILLREDYT
jgi:predicted nuclease of predicted toxin-antitoxin system